MVWTSGSREAEQPALISAIGEMKSVQKEAANDLILIAAGHDS